MSPRSIGLQDTKSSGSSSSQHSQNLRQQFTQAYKYKTEVLLCNHLFRGMSNCQWAKKLDFNLHQMNGWQFYTVYKKILFSNWSEKVMKLFMTVTYFHLQYLCWMYIGLKKILCFSAKTWITIQQHLKMHGYLKSWRLQRVQSTPKIQRDNLKSPTIVLKTEVTSNTLPHPIFRKGE